MGQLIYLIFYLFLYFAPVSDFKIFIFTSTVLFQPILHHFQYSILVDHPSYFLLAFNVHPLSRASSTYTWYMAESSVIIGLTNK